MGSMTSLPGPVGAPQPLSYPGRALTRAGVLTGDGVRPWPAGDDAVLAGRSAVLSVGSNGDPRVLRAKLDAAGVSTLVPLAPAVVVGIVVAHSAHVSLGGYVAAAPCDAPSGAVRGVVTWLDPTQLAALDASEPNYRRVPLSPSRYLVAPVQGHHLTQVSVYRSIWGLLAVDGRPVPLHRQDRLHRILARDPVVAARLPLDDSERAVRLLRDQYLQVWLRRHWARAGHTARDGLVTGSRPA
jgi:hypothetical protein